jgi:hypothetical protein
MIEATKEEIQKLFVQLQSLFTDGLITIVGSGLSCAEGLPAMGQLADELSVKVPSKISATSFPLWEEIQVHLSAGLGLELALHKVQPNDEIEQAIVEITADFVQTKEYEVIGELLNSGRTLKFTHILPHLSPTNPKIVKIITTNYDRLIEFAAERIGWGVDTMMLGRYWGVHNPDASDKSFVVNVSQNTRAPRLIYRNRIKLFKPHGSLDWYESSDGVISSIYPVNTQKVIITPGLSKYKKRYQTPFDTHREQGNAAIDSATGVLCLGYGFNDEHLQTHLMAKLRKGTKGLLLTRSLSDNARAVISVAPNFVAFSAYSDGPVSGTLITQSTGEFVIPDVNYWDVEQFVKGVL